MADDMFISLLINSSDKRLLTESIGLNVHVKLSVYSNWIIRNILH